MPSNDDSTAEQSAAAAATVRTRTRSRSRAEVTTTDAPSGASDTPEKPATKRAATKKAATKKVATKKAATKKAATKKAATKKAATKKAEVAAEVVEAESPPADAEGPTRRTRKRSTSAGQPSAGVQSSKDVGSPADVAGEPAGDDRPNGPEGTSEERPAGSRRRRGGRGRRGRGRGGAGEDQGAGRASTGDDSGDDADEPALLTEDPGAGTRERDGRRRSGRKGASSRGEGEGEGDEPRIVRGGTRLAAKKARRAGAGGGSNGGAARRRERPGGVSEEERRAILAGPPKTMLVTAKPERTQIAVLEDRTLVEHYVTRDEDVTFVGNIYMGRVQNVLPGMEAAFLDIGKGRNGVLYAGEVLYDELDVEEESDQRIENVLKPGKKVLVQVTKDPMGTKGPRLTMHLSLAGRYVVLAPNSTLFGISRKLTDEERDRLRRIVKAAKPDGHGVIVRTAAEGATEEQLTADVQRLVARWEKVEASASRAKPLEAVYEEPKLVVKVIRDIFGPDFVRCIIDDENLHSQVRDYLEEVAPELLDRVELYGAPTDDARSQAAGAPSRADGEAEVAAAAAGDAPQPTPEERRRSLPELFHAFDVTDQLRQAMHRKVWLPSGGYLIIESTEAMKVIDVNTGRFTGGSDSNLEEVVLKTNLEAAEEIVRQLRLRDMGGMIIIDFIDMLLKSNQDQVVRRLKRELLRDRTKTRVSDVSRLGLVQMTRKNVSQGLVESFSSTCEACEGHGFTTHLS
jgi:Rne/Rng family ribonuclease